MRVIFQDQTIDLLPGWIAVYRDSDKTLTVGNRASHSQVTCYGIAIPCTKQEAIVMNQLVNLAFDKALAYIDISNSVKEIPNG